jgi:hypothetical protein
MRLRNGRQVRDTAGAFVFVDKSLPFRLSRNAKSVICQFG